MDVKRQNKTFLPQVTGEPHTGQACALQKRRRPHQPLGEDRGRQKRRGRPHVAEAGRGTAASPSAVTVPGSRRGTAHRQPLPDVPRVQPAVFVQSLRCLCWLLQVALKHVRPFHAHLGGKGRGGGGVGGGTGGAQSQAQLPAALRGEKHQCGGWRSLRGGDLGLVQRGAPESLPPEEKNIFSLFLYLYEVTGISYIHCGNPFAGRVSQVMTLRGHRELLLSCVPMTPQ